ncbi:Peptidase S74 domain-containing protein (Fragment) [Durusdinium trenchii]|uniref:Peptidase S74 domain-containing protein n=1 Tax=Durusdinium trenchii TaxID=1381693 RepID=A0ABP0NMS6_9DINO
MGSCTSLRSFARPGLVVPVVDFAHFGSLMLARGPTRLGLCLSASGFFMVGSCMSVIMHANVGPSLSLRTPPVIKPRRATQSHATSFAYAEPVMFVAAFGHIGFSLLKLGTDLLPPNKSDLRLSAPCSPVLEDLLSAPPRRPHSYSRLGFSSLAFGAAVFGSILSVVNTGVFDKLSVIGATRMASFTSARNLVRPEPVPPASGVSCIEFPPFVVDFGSFDSFPSVRSSARLDSAVLVLGLTHTGSSPFTRGYACLGFSSLVPGTTKLGSVGFYSASVLGYAHLGSSSLARSLA